MIQIRDYISPVDDSKWNLVTIKEALSISLASKMGTGAIIGVLAAMWLSSDTGVGGEGVVLWIFIGMFVMLPITYSEVLFTQVSKLTPRYFIKKQLNNRFAQIYAIGLVTLYAFGFVGFQFTGVQTVVRLFSEQHLAYTFTETSALIGIVLPILLGVTIVILTKSHAIFINTLSSMIFSLVIAYLLFFIIFLINTPDYWLEYGQRIVTDFLQFRSAGVGLPLGLIIGFQRIIQVGETSLGTSSLSSSARLNSPRREAEVQTFATIICIFVAVIVSSYVFSYGHYHIADVALSESGFDRIKGFILTVYSVTGYFGLSIVLAFFIISGFTTILGSFHYINTTLKLTLNKRIAIYLLLISVSGCLSVANFDVIFDATNLLMFIVGGINLIAMARFVSQKIQHVTL
ncbi:sodium:alanine symporter family protein [Psychromonas sp. MME1]